MGVKVLGTGVKLETVKILGMKGEVIEELKLELVDEKSQFYVTPSFSPPSTMFSVTVSMSINLSLSSSLARFHHLLDRTSSFLYPYKKLVATKRILEKKSLNYNFNRLPCYLTVPHLTISDFFIFCLFFFFVIMAKILVFVILVSPMCVFTNIHIIPRLGTTHLVRIGNIFCQLSCNLSHKYQPLYLNSLLLLIKR